MLALVLKQASIVAELSAFAGNGPALRLWSRLGFSPAGPERNGYLPLRRPPRIAGER